MPRVWFRYPDEYGPVVDVDTVPGEGWRIVVASATEPGSTTWVTGPPTVVIIDGAQSDCTFVPLTREVS